MKINKLLEDPITLSYDPILDTDAEVVPTLSAEEAASESLLFIYKRANEQYNIDPSVNAKAYAIVCESDTAKLFEGYKIITVSDARGAYALCCKEQYCSSDLPMPLFIGITGTNGKTTVATLIYNALTSLGISCGFIGTGKIEINRYQLASEDYSMTTPDPDRLYRVIGQMQDVGAKYVVMEVSSHSLSQGRVYPIRFEIGIMTNLSHDHLDYHGRMEEYKRAKAKLFSQCKTGIFNIDDPQVKDIYLGAECSKQTVGIIQDADTKITEYVDRGMSGSSFIAVGKLRRTKIETPLIGAYNVYNVLTAFDALVTLGIAPCEAKRALARTHFIEGRCEIIEDGVTVVIDFAHTPEAFLNLLNTLKSADKSRHNIITVFGCGGNRDRSKRTEMMKAALKYSHHIVVTDDNPRDEDPIKIIGDITEGAPEDRYTVIRDRAEAVRYAIITASEGDIVAILGKGAERFIIDGKKRIAYSDKATAQNALSYRKEYYNEN